MRIAKFECHRVYNTGIKGKIHVYAKPRWRISFELPESEFNTLLKTLFTVSTTRLREELGILITRELAKRVDYLTRFIAWARKKEKIKRKEKAK